ncbi:MAG TPA: hypothetical protein VES20_04780 [Bryobacteraceae bacterium]|nr:hypothetical protein [Bryobacteraceae bacterium]
MKTLLLGGAVAIACFGLDLPFKVSRSSEVVAEFRLNAAVPSALTLTVDDSREQHLISTGVPHRISLGRLGAGQHRLRITPDARILDLRFEEHTEPEYAHAPVIYARDRSLSDVPLLMYCQPLPDGSLEYTVIFSNEDGGTSTRALMARWGRATDIEYLYRVWPQSGRAIVQGRNHVDSDFRGPYEERHPVLGVITTNNMVGPVPAERKGHRFALAPLVLKELGGSREAVMDRVPETYAAMAQELEREGKLRSFGTVDGQKISDPRNYAYIEYDATHRQSAFSVSVALRDGRVFVNDVGRPDYAISRDGAVRTTVELPPGTRETDVAHLEFRCFVPPPQSRTETFAVAGSCRLNRVLKAFFLSREYFPGESWLKMDRSVDLLTGQAMTLRR